MNNHPEHQLHSHHQQLTEGQRSWQSCSAKLQLSLPLLSRVWLPAQVAMIGVGCTLRERSHVSLDGSRPAHTGHGWGWGPT